MTRVREIPETIMPNLWICYRNRHPLAGNMTAMGDDEVRLKVFKSIGKYLSNAGIRKWYQIIEQALILNGANQR